ncbi:DICT sensory domain-containing protein [Umezawaea sp.]|uniref:DICT sensory domain-containing protein n=1 Tax=Umezawaea sp. TaxID=1955258 RepID=UPI002ED3F7A2
MAGPNTNARAGLLTKRTLVVASHAVERAALAGHRDESAIVIAMFQRLPYFEREAEVYRRIAALAPVTIVGMVSDTRPDLPAGITPVLLRRDEDLALEWSVVVLSSTFGACVVATDLEELDFNGTSLEAGRLFRGRWGFRREEAYAEAVRLRDALGDRLPPHVRRRFESVLDSIVEPPSGEVERRSEAALHHLSSRLVRSRDRAESAAARAAGERRDARDPWTGLHTVDSLNAWLGTEVSDTVRLGIVIIEVPGLRTIEASHGASAAVHTENNVADVLSADLRPIDRAARLNGEEFLLVLPGATEHTTRAAADRVRAALADLHRTYPHLSVAARVRAGSTTERPIDLRRLATPSAPVTPRRPPVLSGTFSEEELAAALSR